MDQIPPRSRCRRLLRWFLWGLLGVALLLVVTVWLVDEALAIPGHQGPVTEHFDGRRFKNKESDPVGRGFFAFLRWQWQRQDRPAWQPVAVEPSIPPRTVPAGAMRVTWVGHSTVLIQTGGVNILTDPIWAERASPFTWAGPQRCAAPGVRFADLPPIQLVLLSHDHYDHADLDTLRRLAERDRPLIVTGLGNERLLEAHGIVGSHALDWWQSLVALPGVTVTAVPARHFSGRSLSDRNRSLWCGFVVGTEAGSLYFAGDSGWGEHFAAIGARFPGLRLALIPIGAYLPRWIMAPVHVDPAEAVRAAQAVGAATNLAIHWGTFPLADDPQDLPPRDLAAALQALSSPPRFWVFKPGEGRDCP